jgi:hypothetical protein
LPGSERRGKARFFLPLTWGGVEREGKMKGEKARPRPRKYGSGMEQADGSWMESEREGPRRAYVRIEGTAQYRVVRAAGVADTYFSVAAGVKLGGKWVRGFVTTCHTLPCDGFVFIPERRVKPAAEQVFVEDGLVARLVAEYRCSSDPLGLLHHRCMIADRLEELGFAEMAGLWRPGRESDGEAES